MSDPGAQVVIRKSEPSDLDFIMDAWIRGQYYGSPHWVQIPKQIFHAQYALHISSLLKRASIDVAVLSEDSNTIIGFLVYSGPIAHWGYTKADYRGHGILNMLLKGKSIHTVTCTTLPGATITKKKKLTFNPFFIGES